MQVPDELKKCVVFLKFRDKRTSEERFAGTGFFVGLKQEELYFNYLVTAKHVIVGIENQSIDGKVLIRINDNQGGVKTVESDVKDWIDNPEDTSVDIKILIWLPQPDHDWRTLATSLIATDEIIKKRSIGVGDDLFITGLFVHRSGKARNIPILRVGNIAAMPEEKIDTKEFGSIDAYLVEARSIGGLSGSPVFVYLDNMRTGTIILGGNQKTPGFGGRAYYLLGIMHGHFDGNESEFDNVAQDITGNGRINMGIGIVIPATKLLEIINQPRLSEFRQLVLNKYKERQHPPSDTPPE
jgi:hypothetical protein